MPITSYILFSIMFLVYNMYMIQLQFYCFIIKLLAWHLYDYSLNVYAIAKVATQLVKFLLKRYTTQIIDQPYLL